MLFSTIATSFLATVASAAAMRDAAGGAVVKRDCHKSGDTWGPNKENAKSAAIQACTQAFVGPSGKTTFTAGTRIQQCYNLDSNMKVDFVVGVNAENDLELTADRCASELQDEINGCEHGGIWEGTDFVWSADPGSGQCASGV